MRWLLTVIACATCAACGTAPLTGAAVAEQRYTVVADGSQGGGVWRLDRQTGALEHCTHGMLDGALRCTQAPAPDPAGIRTK